MALKTYYYPNSFCTSCSNADSAARQCSRKYRRLKFPILKLFILQGKKIVNAEDIDGCYECTVQLYGDQGISKKTCTLSVSVFFLIISHVSAKNIAGR